MRSKDGTTAASSLLGNQPKLPDQGVQVSKGEKLCLSWLLVDLVAHGVEGQSAQRFAAKRTAPE